MSDPQAANALNPVRSRTIALIGLMGAGKTTVGRRLANVLALPFTDADTEIEAAAGCSINDIFERHGEAEFRRGEALVMERLLAGPPHVLATGGGAFMNPDIRDLIRTHAVSVWLRADLDLLMKRVLRRDTRPLLHTGDPRQTMADLMKERYPTYGQADIIIDSVEGAHEVVVHAILTALDAHYEEQHR